MNDPILRNSLRTPDGTEIVSTHRHDYVTYEDANGKTYMVDGGTSYLRRAGHADATDTSVFMSSPHEERREAFTWGTYGKNGNEPLQRKKLSALSDEHIQAILDTQIQIKDHTRALLVCEQVYRDGQT